MSEPKPYASLSSSLLARKGTAKPAMRPQAFHISGDLSRPAFQGEDDLGWNDMGFDPAGSDVVEPAPAAVLAIRPAAEPVALHGAVVPEAIVSPAVEQQSMLAEEFAPPAEPVVAKQKAIRAVAGSKPKAAFTLRLDAERHLRLRLVCAVQHRSAQQVVTQALDDFLARQPGIDNALSSQAR